MVITCFHFVLRGNTGKLKCWCLGNRNTERERVVLRGNTGKLDCWCLGIRNAERERESMIIINYLSKLELKIVSLLTSGWKDRSWVDEHSFSFIP